MPLKSGDRGIPESHNKYIRVNLVIQKADTKYERYFGQCIRAFLLQNENEINIDEVDKLNETILIYSKLVVVKQFV